jgi:hypothetical protein
MGEKKRRVKKYSPPQACLWGGSNAHLSSNALRGGSSLLEWSELL